MFYLQKVLYINYIVKYFSLILQQLLSYKR